MSKEKEHSRFNIGRRALSFVYAFRGVGVMLASQHNAWIHAVATIVVLAAGFAFGLSAMEWCWIVLSVMAVWTAEALNTAFEFLADAAQPDFHPLVKRAKDVAAGAVLISAIGSIVIALLVFGPRIAEMLRP
jgi:diacylglycerol kinase (ATP)